MVHSATLSKSDAYFRMPILGCQKYYSRTVDTVETISLVLKSQDRTFWIFFFFPDEFESVFPMPGC